MRHSRLALAIVVAALVLVPLLPSVKAPVLGPYEAWGIARNEAGAALGPGTPIRTFIDGVDYSNFTAVYRADGAYQTQIGGNWYVVTVSETPAIKEGGDPTDPVMFADGDLTTGGKVFRQDATWQTLVIQTLDLQEAVAAKQPALLKICRVTTQPGDGLSQYAYLYNPTASAVDLSNYFFQKDTIGVGGYSGPTVALTGTVPAGSEIFADFLSDTYLTRTGDALKLVYTNPGGADSPFGGRNVVVDRVEFNATGGGTLYWEPGNTIMTDAPAPGNDPGNNGEIHRAPNCGSDTNQGTDFVVGPETGRPTAPTVIVSTPNGGQRWTGGNQHYIYWNMTDAQTPNPTTLTVTITYSTDSGATYPNTIVSGRVGVANADRYQWTVPNIDTDTARVKVCATDRTALTGCDESDADFSIDSTPPTVTSTTPAAGATEVVLSQDIIIQFSEPMNTASVESQFSLAPDLNPKTYQWNTPVNDTLTVVLPDLSQRTTYQACVGTLARDASDPGKYLAGAPKCWQFSTFKNDPPVISITAPVGGERWSGNSVHTIRWTMTDDRTSQSQLVPYLNYTSSAGNGNIAGPLTGQTSYDWTVACINAADVKVQLTVIDGDGAQSSVESFQFTIDCTSPTVTSTTPADGATGVSISTAIEVQFSEDMDHASVQTAFSINPNPAGLAFNWVGNRVTVTHNNFLPGTHYAVTISTTAEDTSDPGLAMASDYTFAFDTAANHAPTVTVQAPTAGSSYAPGAVVTIQWTMDDIETPKANLIVYVNWTSSAGSGSIAGPLTGDETFDWTAPNINANDVRIRVTVIDGGGLSATADSGAFAITGGGLDVMVLAIVAIIIIVIVLVLLFFLMSKRRKKKEEEAPAEVEEAPPERAPPPPPMAAAPAPRAPAAAPPPAAAGGTKECPSCGTIIEAKDAECFMCGHKFE